MLPFLLVGVWVSGLGFCWFSDWLLFVFWVCCMLVSGLRGVGFVCVCVYL